MKSIMIVLEYYKSLLIVICAELRSLPVGRLVRRGKHYCHATNGKEVGITTDKKLIIKLTRKKYLLKLKKKLENNISILSYCINKLDPIATPNEIIRSLSSAYRGQPRSYFFHPSTSGWLAERYQKNPFPLEGQTYTTEKGVTVRSKSEYIIATLLERYNIPYRYDAAVRLCGQIKYPDFIILNPFNGKVIIWEHFGGLDYSGYEDKMNIKMTLYKKAGYIPFETLIYTFECDIETQVLKDIVEDIIMKP